MSEQERLLRIAGQMIILRDDLEELGFDYKLKQLTTRWIKEANRKLAQMSGGGKEADEQLVEIAQRFDKILRLDHERTH